MKTINKLLIANRGEIAVRIIRTAQSMGIYTVAIHSQQDRYALHVKEADESRSLGAGSIGDTYLNMDLIISIAENTHCDAIHPGYGFLSENPDFARACEMNDLIFIGPSAEAMRIMGHKTEAADFVSKLNIPLPGVKTGTPQELSRLVSNEELPVMIKAAAGGGGKGMRIVSEKTRLEEELKAAAREAQSYFGNDTVYIEKYIENPRHIEVQILGDSHGNYIHLGERECTIQRRHQKILEESPSPSIDEETRKKMGNTAVRIAEAIEYTGAGTVEFLLDENMNFYFLEMNTRIQVEHPVTEMVTGTDLVREQIRIARGMPLRFNQNDITFNGHAIELRIYAEDPGNNFLPAPGKIRQLVFPDQMKNVRIDAGFTVHDEITADYDPLIAKLIAWADNRQAALELLNNALEQTVILGIRHNLSYLKGIINHEEYRNNRIDTGFINHYHSQILASREKEKQQIDQRLLMAAYVFFKSINNSENPHEHVWNAIGYWRPHMLWHLKIGNQEHRFSFTRNNMTLSLNQGKNIWRAKVVQRGQDHLALKTDQKQTTVYFSRINEVKTELAIRGNYFELFDTNYHDIVANKNIKQSQQKNINGEPIKSPMFGKILNIQVDEEMNVKKGQTLAVVEAMKMENNILAPHDARIKHIPVAEGEQVKDGQIIMETYSTNQYTNR